MQVFSSTAAMPGKSNASIEYMEYNIKICSKRKDKIEFSFRKPANKKIRGLAYSQIFFVRRALNEHSTDTQFSLDHGHLTLNT